LRVSFSRPLRLLAGAGAATLAAAALLACGGADRGGAAPGQPAAERADRDHAAVRQSTSATATTATTACAVGAPASSATRVLSLSMSGCTGVQRFQVSERPDFTLPVSINVDSLAADATSARVSVSYAGSAAGSAVGPAAAYALPPTTSTLRVLAVVITFVDDEGNTPGLAAYETPTWAQRLVFGDGVIGADGRFKFNSFKDHVYQSTNGRVLVAGQAYPRVLRLPLEPFRRVLGGGLTDYGRAIRAALNADDPSFLATQQFDHIIGLGSAVGSVTRGVWHNGPGWQVMASTIDTTRSMLDDELTEVRTAYDAQTVIPRFNAATVTGVWLESDAARTGTNYYTGGSIQWTNATKSNYLRLGTALPAAGTRVQVRYSPGARGTSGSTADTQAGSADWVQTMFHENYHVIGARPGFVRSLRTGVGDLYRSPLLLAGFDLMAAAGDPLADGQGGTFYPPTLLSLPHKAMLGWVTPYTLRHGGSESNLALARAEFADAAHAAANVTAIRVPLKRPGDPSFATRGQAGWADLAGYASSFTSVSAYSGQEYLLLELRSRAALPDERFNFDGAVPEGVVVYRVLEADPLGGTGVNDLIEVIDATPPGAGLWSSGSGSLAPLGHGSGVFSLAVPELWQDKRADGDTHAFKVLLSEGRGAKTVYVRFADAAGNLLGQSQFSVQLESDEVAADRLPTVRTALGTTYVSGQRRLDATYATPNGVRGGVVYLDGKRLVATGTQGESNGSFSLNFTDKDVATGTREFKAVVLDAGGRLAESTLAYSGGTATALSGATGLAATAGPGQVTLQWAESEFGRLSFLRHYEIWRDGELLATTTGGMAWDYSPRAGATHSYQIVARALDGSGAAPSGAVSVLIPGGSTTGTSTPCTRTAPTLTPSLQALTLAAGASATVDYTLTNTQGGACGTGTFNLSTQMPTSWTVSLSPTSHALAPGASATGSLSVSAPAAGTTTTASGSGATVLTLAAADAAAATAATQVTIDVTVAPPPCTRAKPTLTLSPASANATAGQATALNAELRNNDSASCAARTFALTGTLPAGWSGQLGAASAAPAPGAASLTAWNVTPPATASGTHALSLTVADALGSATASATLNAQPAADTAAPKVQITSPAGGASASRKSAFVFSIAASASDDRGVARVEFSVDGQPLATDTTAPYAATWDASRATRGNHVITATAFDAAGNRASASVTVKR
jgi:hypothetical protein